LLALASLGLAAAGRAGPLASPPLPEPAPFPSASSPPSGPAPQRLESGLFLIASPGMVDPNFAETVVLLIEYGGAGAMGLVINRPSEHSLASALPELESLQGRSDSLYVGGPVGTDRIVLLFRTANPPPESAHVVHDIYVSASEIALKALLDREQSSEKFHAFAGHAGWAPGQLDSEMARGGWRLAEADAEIVFELEPGLVWPELIKRTSGLWVEAGNGDSFVR
jgi:putative transcriptional regulator